MVLRAYKLVIQTALLLQILQSSVSVYGGATTENFDNSLLATNDARGTVSARNVPDSDDLDLEDQGRRGYFDWNTEFEDEDEDNERSFNFEDEDDDEDEERTTMDGDFVLTTPIPGAAERPSSASIIAKYGHLADDFDSKSDSDESDSTASDDDDDASTSSGSEDSKSGPGSDDSSSGPDYDDSVSGSGSEGSSSSDKEDEATKPPKKNKEESSSDDQDKLMTELMEGLSKEDRWALFGNGSPDMAPGSNDDKAKAGHGSEATGTGGDDEDTASGDDEDTASGGDEDTTSSVEEDGEDTTSSVEEDDDESGLLSSSSSLDVDALLDGLLTGSSNTDLGDLSGLLGSGSIDLDDLAGEVGSGSIDTSELLDYPSGSDSELAPTNGSAATGDVNDMLAALLGGGGTGSGDDLLAGLMAAGGLGSGSAAMAEMATGLSEMFSSGGGMMMNMFPDPDVPQNKTIEDDDILLGTIYGGLEGGDAFSDIRNVRFGQMVVNITLRGADRLDKISLMVMTQEVIGSLVHGGDGGGEAYLEPKMGETIDCVDVHWDKHKKRTMIFYMNMTLSGGRSISAGRETPNRATIKAPEGYQIAGFHGRADGKGIHALGGVFTRIGVQDLVVTDAMFLPEHAAPDVYNYATTIRNWVGPLDVAADTACYQKKIEVSSNNTCPSGYHVEDDDCVTQCPLHYPVDCFQQCLPQNADCTQEIVAKVVSVLGVAVTAALNVATAGIFGGLLAGFKSVHFVLMCAIQVINAIKSIIYYLRYKQIIIPHTETEKLMDKAFQLQIVILDLPMAICACLRINIPPRLQFSATVLGVTSAIVMMAVMVGEALFASSDNILLMLREAGAVNTTKLSTENTELDEFLHSKNGTCGYEMKTLTNRVMAKVNEVRIDTPESAEKDMHVIVGNSSIILHDIPIVTNHCMGEIWANKTMAAAFGTRNLLRKTLGVIVDQLIEDGGTDMGKHLTKKEKAIEYSNLGLFMLSIFDPTGIAWMASEFVQPICGPTEYIGEIDDGTLYDALGLNTVDQAFHGSYGIWKKEGNGTVTLLFESVDKYDVDVVIRSGGDKIAEVTVPSHGNVTWTSSVEKLQDKTLYLDRWRPGLFGLPGSGGGSLLMWIPRSSQGGELILHARLNVS